MVISNPINEFQEIRKILEDPQSVFLQDPNNFRLPIHKRLLKTIKGLESNTVGKGDITSLVRQYLLTEETHQQGRMHLTISVPKGPLWPDLSDWEKSSMRVVQNLTDKLILRSESWNPTWLDTPSGTNIDDQLLSTIERRGYGGVSADPFLNKLGFSTYLSEGQKAVIRNTLIMPDGATLVANLPTGSGKSLCAHIPALINSQDNKTTIVIVPTTSLSIDQESEVHKAFGDQIPHPCSYFSSNTPEVAEKNRRIRERILQGTQKIVFTSPEALMQSLQWPTRKAAEQGLIRTLVIDECHIVNDWGDGFRPAFQQISGFRSHLLDISPNKFPTILLSATLTMETLSVLKDLFGNPGPFKIISANQLRPEPSYWLKSCYTHDEKYTRVLEAVYNLPKPMIIYTTKIEDAITLTEYLRKGGIKRVNYYTGSRTSATDKETRNRNWRNEDLDIMVANSAFGLGVNQNDVRTVIHACVPETIDRFYQEVGRGGRDGHPCVSLMLFTSADIATGAGMSQERLIGEERGWERWKSIFDNGSKFAGHSGHYQKFILNLNTPPGFANLTDLNMTRRGNREWHLRTIALMVRAGLIKWDVHIPDVNSQPTLGEADLPDLDFDTVCVTILDDSHKIESHWKSIIAARRDSEMKSDHQVFAPLRKLIESPETSCMSDLFYNTYNIEMPQHSIGALARSCGGCPNCRVRERSPFTETINQPPPVWTNLKVSLGPLLDSLRKQYGDHILVFYDNDDQVTDLMTRLIYQGIKQIIAPPDSIDSWLRSAPSEINDYTFFTETKFPSYHGNVLKIPTLYYCEPDKNPDLNTYNSLPFSIRLHHVSATDSNIPPRLLLDVSSKTMRYKELATQWSLR